LQLEHTFTVPAGIDEAWGVLLDIEKVAPCMPGAALDSVDGDDFTGTVKVRLGPIGLTYKGKASFVEKNEAERRAVIDAHGKDARGNGTAAAKVTATLVAESEQSTKVSVVTDLNITGKPAQFGRGVMVDVGNKLIGQFADCLAGKLAGTDAAGPEASNAASESPAPPSPAAVSEAEPAANAEQSATAQPTPAAAEQAEAAAVSASPPPRPVTPSRRPGADEVEPIDLLGSAGPAVAKRLAPLAVVLIVLFWLWRRRR